MDEEEAASDLTLCRFARTSDNSLSHGIGSVTLHSQRMTVACGGRVKEAALDGQIIRATRLEEIAASVAKK
ncbi:MAG: hypothetical protein M5U08_16885 [Burkholderiales bacterium]|nr:hypothetical protein [Burkholderiales bacterium]